MALNNKVINWKFPFQKGSEGIPSGNRTTLDATRENLKVLLMTRKGERLLFPTIGTNIPVLTGELFNNISKEEMLPKIRSEILNVVESFLPNINITDVQLLTKEDLTYLEDTQIMIRITYSLKNAPNLVDQVQLRI